MESENTKETFQAGRIQEQCPNDAWDKETTDAVALFLSTLPELRYSSEAKGSRRACDRDNEVPTF